MKTYRLVGALVLIAAITMMSGCCHPKKIAGLTVPLIAQHRDCWCWAATTEMISTFYGHPIKQCDSANFVHGTPPDCCTGCSGNCPGWGWGWGASIDDIKNNWTHWKFQYSFMASSLSWTDVTSTLSPELGCKNSPIQVVWWWTGGGGHVIAAYGYAEAGGQKYVSYLNPWPPDCSKKGDTCTPVTGGDDTVMLYDSFVSAADHTWGDSFYAFKYVP